MHTMHLLSGVAKQPNLELKTRPTQLLGSLRLVIALPAETYHFNKWRVGIKSSFFAQFFFQVLQKNFLK